MPALDLRRERLARDLFLAALDVSGEQRAALVAGGCGGDAELAREVGALFACHRGSGGFLEAPLVATGLVEEPPVARRIGRYRMAGVLGHGGSSTVLRGVAPDGTQAAVKVLRCAPATAERRRRFAAERDLLATLRHPFIAAFLDAGTTEEGVPWLATEVVDGLPITDHCDLHALPVNARLQLFVAVCAAVEHAHARQIVHRDLKPSNVLVDADGRPRLLDFGIAKLLGAGGAETTETAARVLTLNYASPEHLAGRPVTPAADVYSLGVVLCELLCGRRPRDWSAAPPGDLARELARAPPPRLGRLLGGDGAEGIAALRSTSPAGLGRELRGALASIVERALAAEPERRYGSAGELAADLHRYLAGAPVAARRSSLRYGAGRFLRRHLEAVAASAGAVLLTSGLLAAGGCHLRRELRHERAVAERARHDEAAAHREADQARRQARQTATLLLTARRQLDLAQAPPRRCAADGQVSPGSLPAAADPATETPLPRAGRLASEP